MLVRPPTVIPVRVRPLSVSPVQTDRNPYGRSGPELTFFADNFTGGDAAVPAYYSRNGGVTATTTISQWDDFRGSSGFGPSLVQATGAKRPGWDSANLLATFNGSQNIGCAANALFEIDGAGYLFMIAAVEPTAADAYPLAICDSTSVARLLAVRFHQASGLLQCETTTQATSSVLADAAVYRLIIASKGATTAIAIDVPDAAQGTATGVAQAAGNNCYTVGNYVDGGGNPAKLIAKCHGYVAGRQPTAGDIAVLKQLAAYHPFTLAS